MKSLQNCFCNRSPIYFLISILFFSISSFAQVAPVSPPTTGFAIDGGLRANTPTSPLPFAANQGDWYPGSGGTGTSVFNESGVPISPATTQTSGRANPTDPFNGGDDVFSNGSKFNDYIGDLRWTTNSAPDKNDINNSLYHIARDGDNNQWAFIAGDRLSTNGTSYIDFEFLQGSVTKIAGGTFSGTPVANKPNGGGRTENDMIVSMEYTNGGSKPLVYVYQWKQSGSTWSYQLVQNLAAADAFAETNRNGAETDVPYLAFGSNTYQQYAFVEAAINITHLLQLSGQACADISIKTLWVKTKAAASSTAALKDFIDPISVNLNFGSTAIINPGPFCASDNTAYTLQTDPNLNGGTFTINRGGVTSNITTFTPSAEGAGTYPISYSFSGCSAQTSFIVNALPTLGGPASVCVGSTINLTPASGGTWSSSDNSKATITNGGVVSGLTNGSVTFTFTNTTTNCSNTKTVTVNALPTLGGNGSVCVGNTITLTPTSGGTWSSSDNSKATITNAGLVTGVAAGSVTFTFTNTTTGCSNTKSVTINAKPSTPTTTPSMNPCTQTTYSVSVENLGNGTYTLTQGATTKTFIVPANGTTINFTGLTPGSGYSVTFENTAGCTSGAASCPSSSARMSTSSQTIEQKINIEEETKVLAYPNPFSDKVKFVITSSIKGKGILEVYDMLGQKVKTVYQGNMTTGSQTFELSLPRQNLGNLIYVLRIGDKRVSGKLLQIKQ